MQTNNHAHACSYGRLRDLIYVFMGVKLQRSISSPPFHEQRCQTWTEMDIIYLGTLQCPVKVPERTRLFRVQVFLSFDKKSKRNTCKWSHSRYWGDLLPWRAGAKEEKIFPAVSIQRWGVCSHKRHPASFLFLNISTGCSCLSLHHLCRRRQLWVGKMRNKAGGGEQKNQ